MMRQWWIDESVLLAGSNPSDEQLAGLRSHRFRLAVSLLDENRHPPKYDRKSAAGAGWALYRIPIRNGIAPSLVQVCEFAALIGALPQATKTLVFCENGLARSAFMGAVYWIAKGLTLPAAAARIADSAGEDPGLQAEGWDDVLRKFEQLRWRIRA
jgi:hypothetical protein